MALDTPIAFIIFNRPGVTQRVFEAIAQAKPRRLLVVADGPRTERPGEWEQCVAARAVVNNVDWECEVLTNFSETNMGCKRRVSSGLDWVFSQVDEAIILEDDCLPNPSFFPYCADLLKRHRDNSEIMAVTGCNFQVDNNTTPYSYFFSRYVHVWGWASWSRAWKHYDVGMQAWPDLRETSWLTDITENEASLRYWTDIFDQVTSGQIDTWDFQWLFACWKANGLAVQPNKNLISNIGFGERATHTTSSSPYADLPTCNLEFPLQHPPLVERNIVADRYTRDVIFSPVTVSHERSLSGRLARFVRAVISQFLSRQAPVFHAD